MKTIKSSQQANDYNYMLDEIINYYIPSKISKNKQCTITTVDIKKNLNNYNIRYSQNIETDIINKILEKYSIKEVENNIKYITNNKIKKQNEYIIINKERF